MRLALIDFYIRNQKLSKIGPKLVADSINYVDCSFTFRTDDWNGIDKWVVFKKGEESYRVNLVNDSIPEEAGLNLGAGLWFVSLFGENAEGTKRITTNSVTVEVAKSAIPEGGPLPVIELTEAEQIAAKAQKALDTANEVLLKAENGDFDGLPGKTPNIQIGEVVTLEPGTEATASITGTAEEPRLNLGIPQGEPGKDGEGGGSGAEVTAESIEVALGYVPANPKDIPTVPTNVSAFNNDAGYVKTSELPTKTSELSNDSGFITAEDIPAAPEIPVKSVNGKTGAVQLSATDVGAHPSTWMPTAEEVGAKPASYNPTYEDVGADKEGKATEEVGKHNVSENAHNDIRVKLSELQAAIEAFLNINDTEFDQLSELIEKIRENAGSIEQLTNGKVNVADIVNNLTTNVVNKPLSAAQGVVLKGLIDALDTLANGAKNTADEAKNLAGKAVRFDIEQSLSENEKERTRKNINAPSVDEMQNYVAEEVEKASGTEIVEKTTTYTLDGRDGSTKVTDIVGLLYASNGAWDSTSAYRSTTFLPIGADSIIEVNLYGYTTVGSVCFYTSAKTFISAVAASSYAYVTGNIAVPENAAYVRFCFSTTSSVIANEYATVTNYTTVNTDEIASNPLYQKSLTVTGDSITIGTDTTGSYGLYIAEKNEMTFENKAIWGATIASGISGSSGCILDTISSMNENADYVILSGGVNDYERMDAGVETLGTISDFYSTSYNTATFCGALEQLCYNAITRWRTSNHPNTKILFVICHNCSNSFNNTWTDTYIPSTIEILNKWGIPYVDLFSTVPPIRSIDALKTLYTNRTVDGAEVADGWHLNELGYKQLYCPPIETALKYSVAQTGFGGITKADVLALIQSNMPESGDGVSY